MATLTLAQICDGIATTLSATSGLEVTQSYDELTESANDFPMLQVYWENASQDSQYAADRTTFGGGIRQTSVLVRADLYASQRNELKEDMADVLTLTEAVITVLEQQDQAPYFDLSGVGAFSWVVSRVNFQLGDPQILYPGARFEITLFLK